MILQLFHCTRAVRAVHRPPIKRGWDSLLLRQASSLSRGKQAPISKWISHFSQLESRGCEFKSIRTLRTKSSEADHPQVITAIDVPLAARHSDVVDLVIRAAEKAVTRTNTKILSIQKELKSPEEAEAYKTFGDALLLLPRKQWRRGLTEVEVANWAEYDGDGQPLKQNVPLDPQLDFQQNAEEFFKKQRKILRALKNAESRLVAARKELVSQEEYVATAREIQEHIKSDLVLKDSSVLDELYRIHDLLQAQGLIPKPPQTSISSVQPASLKKKYGADIDTFTSPGGHEIVAGRSAKSNERVSFQLTKADQCWFHTANGIPGSHVLLRCAFNDATDEDIEVAARIAAFHSHAKENRKVEIMYCRGSQLRRPSGRGKRLGAVQVKGATSTIVVKPALPTDS